MKFKQKAWLKPYIDFNTQKRSESIFKFDKDYFKLMNNIIYGKSVENKGKYKLIHLVTRWDAPGKRLCAKKLIAKPNFKSVSIFEEEFCAIEMTPLTIKLDRPTYVGFSILEFSKVTMNSFFHDYLKPKFGDALDVCYSDTDCFLFRVTTEDFKADIRNDLKTRHFRIRT